MKWRSATWILHDHGIPIKLKEKFYKTIIQPAMLYGVECWVVEKQHMHNMSLPIMKMLR